MVEQLAYTVLKKIDDVELREYQTYLLAVVKNVDDDQAFGILFNYISGANRTQRKISMTAPVISSEKISMTTPVISQNNYMAFVMPSSYSKETIPLPNDSRVQIHVESQKKVAVLRFSGYTTNKRVTNFSRQLINTLQRNGIIFKGEPFLMRYNGPFTPGFLRRNEVAVEIH